MAASLKAHECWDVIVIGGGAAGLFAATVAAERGRRTLLLEKNQQLGVKILMSGGTRCNITHDCTWREIVDRFSPAARQFLKTAVASLTPQQVIDRIEAEGVLTKVESTGKVFPVSNRAIDVRDALQRRMQRAGTQVQLGCAVQSIHSASQSFVCRCLLTTASRAEESSGDEVEFRGRKLIITSGGQSYPGCGTTGDGYAWATTFGHTIQPLKPALTPLITETPWVRELRGVSVESCRLRLYKSMGQRPISEQTAALLCTHFGLSGPGPMNLSRLVPTVATAPRPSIEIDWSSDMSPEILAERFAEWRRAEGKRQVARATPLDVPNRLWNALCLQSGVAPETRWAELPKNTQQRLIQNIKRTRVELHGTMGYRKAEVTAGGVTLSEIDPHTMESRLVSGLFFAGEILDVDGPIGGYNFQAAFSTGALAGNHA